MAILDNAVIRGAGGGGKAPQQRVAVESPDSLVSKQFGRILDLISEGEIVGLVDGLKSVYLDETPLQNADGSFNFNDVVVTEVQGTQVQGYLPGFSTIESEVAVVTEVRIATSVTRAISSPNVDSMRVTLGFPGLSFQNTTTGDLSGSSVQIAIDVDSGGGFVEVLADTITGKTVSKYQRSYIVDLSGPGPWSVRVRRITADSVSVSLVNKTFWDSYTLITEQKLSYPNSAIIGVSIDAAQFQSMPTRGYDVKLLKVLIPDNYNPITRVYTGAWSGAFVVAWTDNPAWCWYDLVTNKRYGLGNFLDPSIVDKWGLYTIAKYCDALVPNGYGGTEPRFTCNLYLQTREEAYGVINSMASIFRGMSYWSTGGIAASQDSPGDVVAQFNAANVVDGVFNYAGSAKHKRHTVALVTWNDPAEAYRQKVEYVEDAIGINRYGIVQTEFVAVGCTSRGQAHRIGKWLLFTERLETEVVTFQSGLDGSALYPGAIIRTQDAARSGKRFGGRVSSATVSAITVDSPITIESGVSYTLSVMLPDGTVHNRAITNPVGATSVLTLAAVLTTAPQTHSVWVLAASTLSPELWRVIALKEVEKMQVEVTALKHHPEKYALVEQGITFEAPAVTSIGLLAQPPTDLTVYESLFESGPGVVAVRVVVSWSGANSRSELRYRKTDDNWISTPVQSSTTTSIDNLAPGNYVFSVVQINALGARSAASTITKEIFGKTAPPVDVTGFSVSKASGFGLASWARSPDLDVRVGGKIVIRHSPLTTGATWQDGYIVEEFEGSAVSGIVPLITGTYMAKALDSSYNWSLGMVSFVATEGMVTGFNTVGTCTEHPTFAGSKTNLVVVNNSLRFTGTSLTGSYLFSTYLDLTTVLTRRFEADITSLAFDEAMLIDSVTTLIDSLGIWDGAVIDDADVTLYAATTDTDPAGAPVWSAWTQFFVADFTCRAIKFKLDYSRDIAGHNIAVSQLTVHAKVPT